jgi:hypothetical protein
VGIQVVARKSGDLQELARQKSPEAINTLVGIMNDEKARHRQRESLLQMPFSTADTASQPSRLRKPWQRSIPAR